MVWGIVSLPVDWAKVGMVQETVGHRSIFPESWICRGFVFASATGMEHSLSNAVMSLSLGRRGLRAPNPIIACVDLLDIFRFSRACCVPLCYGHCS